MWLLRLLLARLLRGVCRAQAKERAIRANRGASRPQNGRPDSGRSAALSFLSSPRQGHWEDLEGDEVLVELTPYDLTKGRITYRFMPGRAGPPGYNP